LKGSVQPNSFVDPVDPSSFKMAQARSRFQLKFFRNAREQQGSTEQFARIPIW
jgi:hypothetical protein